MSNFHKLVMDNQDDLMKAFQRVLQRRKLSNEISLKEIHFAPASPVDRNCKRVTVCRRENGKTVCRTEMQCD